MAEKSFGEMSDSNSVAVWATVFEKEEWSTGDAEIVSTLINISYNTEDIDEPTEKKLRQALRTSGILKEPEIMRVVKGVREAWPKDHWWWYPEKIKGF